MLPEKQSLDELIIDFPESIPFIDFWKLYLNLGYYFLLVPFCLKKSQDTGKLEIHTNKSQRILCGIVQLTILFQYLSLLWWSSRKMDSQNQMSYFTSFCYVGYTGYHLALNSTFWLKQGAFQLVFEHMQKLNFYDQKKKLNTAGWIKKTAFVVSFTALVMGMTDSYLVSNLYTHGRWMDFYGDLQNRSKLIFSGVNVEAETTSVQIMVYCLTILQILILIPSVVLVPYLDLFVLLVPLCVRRIMREFILFCKNSMGSPVATERILKKYTRLRKFIKNLNRSIGILICACVSVSLPYYAAWIGMSIFESNVHPVTLIRVYAFFVIFFIALSLAADINKKGIEFYCWISSLENSDAISSKTITSLLMDLHSNQIALKGLSFFVITYRFLGTIFGVIVTYSIITIQLQVTRRAHGCNNRVVEPNECICPSNSTWNGTLPLL